MKMIQTTMQSLKFWIISFILSTTFLFSLIGCGEWKGIETATDFFTLGNATLSWQPPISNIDGTPVLDLAGYVIYYGQSPGNYTNWVDVGNTASYTITNLETGKYYFALTSYDQSGNESELSNEMSKTIE